MDVYAFQPCSSQSDYIQKISNEHLDHSNDPISDISTSSTVTASDLTGPGRTVGNLYSSFGKRFENGLSRFLERLGFKPCKNERRVLSHFELFPPPGSKADGKLRKDLRRSIRYTNTSACRVLASIASEHPYFRQLLLELGTVRELGLLCSRAEMYGLRDSLLSPSRKVLIRVFEIDISTSGAKWTPLTRGFRTTTRSNLETKGRTNPRNEFFSAHLNSYKVLVKYISSSIPEEAWLALRYLTDPMREFLQHNVDKRSKTYSSDSSRKNDVKISPQIREELDRVRKLHRNLAYRVHCSTGARRLERGRTYLSPVSNSGPGGDKVE